MGDEAWTHGCFLQHPPPLSLQTLTTNGGWTHNHDHNHDHNQTMLPNRPPKTNGCENMGVDGCQEVWDGGVRPSEAERALEDFREIGLIPPQDETETGLIRPR